jgi:hypothetical protein
MPIHLFMQDLDLTAEGFYLLSEIPYLLPEISHRLMEVFWGVISLLQVMDQIYPHHQNRRCQ